MRDEPRNEQKHALDINDLLETMQIDGEETGAKISLRGHAESAFICHPVSLRRMISNLVDNALKYGGQAEISVEDSNQFLTISIADNGTGIPESQMNHVFEPFTRLDESRNKETGGTGLGLSIARNIAVAHGGKLALENRKNGGLLATITLPR
jgi:signal transduction histidine kinase